jgi:hypothetical protein
MKPDDPARWLLSANIHRDKPTVYRDSCYICRDPEFAQMGMPLCKPCWSCNTGHVPADDSVCEDCGADIRDGPGWIEEQ